MKIISALSIFYAFQLCFSVSIPNYNCVSSIDGRPTCSHANLPHLSRQRGTPCARNDFNCWCLKAVEYTNAVRRRYGKSKMLRVGPVSQLNNAIQYSRVLSSLGYLKHQQLADATAKVGCSRHIGGENIAYNYNSGDIAYFCVDQWEKSPGHLQNILRDSNEEVVIGFHYSNDGRVYCVQTFSSVMHGNSAGRPECNAVQIARNIPHRPIPRPVRHRPTPKPKIVSPTKTPSPVTVPVRPSQTPIPRKTIQFYESASNEEESDKNNQHVLAWNDPDGPEIEFWGLFDDKFHSELAEIDSEPSKEESRAEVDEHEANRACRCIEVGKHCWFSLKKKSGNRCEPFQRAVDQPRECRNVCCNYCTSHPKNSVCNNRRVRTVCSSEF